MSGNLNKRPIGRCSQCSGIISVPAIYYSTQRPVPSCESCGAAADPARNLPVIPTSRLTPQEQIEKRKEFIPRTSC